MTLLASRAARAVAAVVVGGLALTTAVRGQAHADTADIADPAHIADPGAPADTTTSADTTDTTTSADTVDVVEVSGTLDTIMASFIERSIDDAVARGSLGLVLQLNSTRATVDPERLQALAERLARAPVPVTMWIGPSGAKATGVVGQLAGIVSDLALAPGSQLGDLGAPAVDPEWFSEVFAAAYEDMRHGVVSSSEAIELGLAREAPTLPFFVLDLPGFRSTVDTSGDEPVRVPVSRVRFAKLSLLDQFMHTAASPAITYLLLLVGAMLLVFELYTAGVGVAGVVGAIAFMLGCYGLAAQPVRVWAIVLLFVAAFGYSVDIQTGVPRVWTVVATICTVVGSLALFEGTTAGWAALTAGILGVPLAMASGMPAMVRTRFSTPTIGREWMIGAQGVARDTVDPEGVVKIDGAPWRARTHRATPIAPGDAVEVVAIEGLTLAVAPAAPDTGPGGRATGDNAPGSAG